MRRVWFATFALQIGQRGQLEPQVSLRPCIFGVRQAKIVIIQRNSSVFYYAEMADPSKFKMRTSLRLGGLLGFVGGFLMAYQRSSCKLHCHDYLISVAHTVFKSDSGVGQRTNAKKRWT